MIVVLIVVVAQQDNAQELREIMAHQAAQFRQQVEDARKGQICIQCPCGWFNYYATPGRAKMGLSGHQRWCRRGNCDAKTSQ